MSNEYRDEFNEGMREAKWTFKKVFWPILGLIILISVIGYVLNLVSQPAKIVSKTLDADNVLYNYEWFKQTYQDVQAIDGKIENAKVQVSQFKEEAGPTALPGIQDNAHRRRRPVFRCRADVWRSLSVRHLRPLWGR